ncbi:MAG: PTS transporter subunit EIIC [Clostridia bacterium]|nr:PTS transporter subunit EIIC [Clostridia bacterium]
MEKGKKEKKSFFESKFMLGLQKGGQKLSQNKGVNAIMAGMMSAMALIMVGALFQLLATIPTLFNWVTTDSGYYKFFITIYNGTTGLLSVFIVFIIGYTYSKSKGLKAIQGGITALACFLVTASPVTTYVLADGTTTVTALNTESLGAVGMFVAIIIGLVSVQITNLFVKKKLIIKMPDVVPPFLQDAFNAMIPLFVNILLWHGLNTLVTSTLSMNLPYAITVLLGYPLMAINSVPGMLLIALLVCLLWCFGIHGTMVAAVGLMAVMMQNIAANSAAVAAGEPAVFYPSLLFMTMACAGGTGNTFGLVLRGLRAKSEQLKAVSKAALIPGLFGINEPVTFGFPIMYNPIMAIPYILTPVITMLLVWVGYLIGFFKPAYILMMTLMPMGVGEFLGSLAWQNLFIPVIGIVVGFFVFGPFFKVYDKQLVEKEAAEKEAQQA